MNKNNGYSKIGYLLIKFIACKELKKAKDENERIKIMQNVGFYSMCLGFILLLVIIGIIIVIFFKVSDINNEITIKEYFSFCGTFVGTIIGAFMSLYILYVNITKQINDLEEQRRFESDLRKEESRPYVVVGFEIDDKRIVHLFIQNIGLAPAININVEIENAIILKNGKDARNILFSKPIKFLTPNHKIDTVLFKPWDMAKENGEYAENNVSVSYYRLNSEKEYKEEYEIDIRPFIGSIYMEHKSIEDVARELSSLNKQISEIQNRMNN